MNRAAIAWLLIIVLLYCPVSCQSGLCAIDTCREHGCDVAPPNLLGSGETTIVLTSAQSGCRHGCRCKTRRNERLEDSHSSEQSQPNHDAPDRELPDEPCQCICGGAVIGAGGKTSQLELGHPVHAASLVTLLDRVEEGGRQVAQSLQLLPPYINSGAAVRRQLCSLLC